ncbi:endonuclease/exonuclease/phosphatase family protein [Nocardioides coralli]|uniref:endonuclease/exonuclease/phosphatase family protein n=1 Tax=Nocardioides coralli TaxID=2872154 RepID=UPI001CA388CD|nr:endonuclease/exonuclease/phosphatase family protein [Nocardioides coralli]QZY28265.1 endonuclease/exonuclease/phosphatase family protein [Nocardioides coralli]
MKRALVVLVAVAVVVTAVVAGLAAADRPTPSPPPPAPSADPDEPPPTTPGQETAAGATLAPCPLPARADLTVLSLNIHAGRTKAGRLDLGRVAAELRAWDADVVLLQEVDRGRRRSDGVDQARWLGRRLGMDAVFGPGRRARPGASGNAVLSRYPIVTSGNQRLPSRAGLYGRGLVRATIDVDGRRVDVFSTHLEHASRRVRTQQAGAVVERVRQSPRPVVVGGDVNAVPGTPPLRRLQRAGLVDAWAVAGRGDGFTVPAYAPRRRIDFVLADRSFRVRSTEVVLSSISDHRGVLAELTLLPAACD